MNMNVSNQALHDQHVSLRVAATTPRAVAAIPAEQALREVGEQEKRPTQEAHADRGQLDDAVARLNDYVQVVRRELEFSVHDDSGMTVVKVLDRESGEVIRQIPSEEALQVVKKLRSDESGESVDPLLFNDLA
jgi:flagellar protein FlaG